MQDSIFRPPDGEKGLGCHSGDWTNPLHNGSTKLVTQLVISSALGIFAFLTFCTLRTRWSTLYAARKKQTKQASALPELPKSFFGWIPVLYRISDEDVLYAAGLDAFVFLGFFKMSMKLLAIATFFGLTVITPVLRYYEGERGTPINDTSTAFNAFEYTGPVQTTFDTSFGTTAEKRPIPPPGPNEYLWMHVVFVYAFTGLTMFFLWNQTKKVVAVRQRYLGSQSTVTDRTIRLSGIPDDLRDEDKLKEMVEGLGIGRVESVMICRNWRELDKLMEERTALLRKLEETWSVFAGARRVERNLTSLPIVQPEPPGLLPVQPDESDREQLLYGNDDEVPYARTRPSMKLKHGFWNWTAVEVDAINYFTEKLDALDEKIREARKKKYDATPMAFVTMDSVSSAQMAVQAVIDPQPLRLIANLAPAPHDIIWANTYMNRRERMMRSWTITLLILVLTIFWVIPVGTLAGLTNICTIRKVWPRLADVIEANDIVSSLIQNFLPTLVLTLLNVLVPYLYDYLASMQGMISQSEVELSVVSKNFFFTFFNLFFLFTVFGTINNIYDILRDSLKDTTRIAYQLAKSLQSFAPFYTNLIVLQGIGMFPFRLLEFGTVVLYPISLIGSKTPRDYAELVAPPVFQYGFFLPQPILILILCLVYSTLQAGTLILGFGLLYFSIGWFTYKYQLLYAMDHPQHSTGQAWPMIVYRVLLGLLVFQSSMAGFLSLQKAFTRGALLVPTILATMWVWWFFRRTFTPLTMFIALRSIEGTPGNVGGEEEEEARLVRVNSETLDETREVGLRFVNPNLVAPLEEVWLAKRAREVAAGDGSNGVLEDTSGHGVHS